MKLSKFVERGRLHVVIVGEIDGGKCDCLEKYWEQHVGNGAPDITVDMTGVDDIDNKGIATIVNLLRDRLGDDMRVTLKSPPQMLAHTVYKIGMTKDKCFSLANPRDEEPYAG